MRGVRAALCIVGITISSIFLGVGVYAQNSGGSFIFDLSSPDTIESVISDIIPGETVYIIMKIPNPKNFLITSMIRIINVICDENVIVEPEQEFYDLQGVRNDIDSVITFGLWIDRDGDASGCDTSEGDEWILDESEGSHIDDVENIYYSGGTIDPGEALTIVTSYHMDEETENWAQSDTMTFNIEITREEVKSTCRPRARFLLLWIQKILKLTWRKKFYARVVNMSTRPAYYRACNTGPWP